MTVQRKDKWLIHNGWLDKAEHKPSPNYDERPSNVCVELVVIHNISLPPNEFGGPWIEDLFMNQLNPDAHPYFATICDLKVSAHVLIRRDGAVVQFVAFDKRAWHAGQSQWQHKTGCNDFAIGIELEGCDTIPFTAAQYISLGQLSRSLMQAYPNITCDNFTGHSDIAPGRKTDPGPYFKWAELNAALQLK